MVDLLQASGTDLTDLRRRLRPPRRVTRLQAEIWRLRRQEDEAVRAGEEERARRLLAGEAGLRDQLAAALDAGTTVGRSLGPTLELDQDGAVPRGGYGDVVGHEDH